MFEIATKAPFMAKSVWKLLRYVLYNFYPDYCLFGLASSGLEEPKCEILGKKGLR